MIDNINQTHYKKVREAPYIYIVSFYGGIFSITALNSYFPGFERTENFKDVEFGEKNTGKTTYRFALLRSEGKGEEVIYRLSRRQAVEEHQLVTIEQGLLGFWCL